MPSPARALYTTMAVSAAVVACSLSSGLDGLQGGQDEGSATAGDASTSPGTPPQDGSVDPGRAGDGGLVDDAASSTRPDAEPATTNIHPNGTFESGCATGWTGFEASTAASSTARSGTGSCQACVGSAATGVYGISDNGSVESPPVGRAYRATAWVRAAPGQPAAAQLSLFLRTYDITAGFQQVEISASPVLASAPATWTRVDVTLKVNVPAQWLQVGLTGVSPPGGCFLTDDVELAVLP